MEEIVCIALFSKPRLESYANLAEHEANFALIARISHKIGILEVIIRNQINSVILRQNEENWWLHLPKEINVIGDFTTMSPTVLISKQSMGFWIEVVKHFKVHNQIFNPSFLDCLDFKRYYHKNKNRFNNTKCLRHYQKTTIILKLLHTLRNRAFHFENLYKYTDKGYPRLNTKISGKPITHINSSRKVLKSKNLQELYIALQPEKIPLFLNDLLESFNPELVNYAEQNTHTEHPLSSGKGSA
ncbi:hypothetical protein [Helicobacter bizzozeronii]|uniref:hypothetical protein n=1 Tax=Helicobacter bizzozeronii TaxID=56877 RepID=UPI000CF1A62F|nr:hypothetical protein [Helicobacter bizzozeronii]